MKRKEVDPSTFAHFPFVFDKPQGKKVHLRSFAGFAKIANEHSNSHGAAWRGQADAKWRLTSGDFRAEKQRLEYWSKVGRIPEDHAKDILCISHGVDERMNLASRAVQKALGTDEHLRLLYRDDLMDRGIQDDPARYGELLTICQHYGMATPLLDVTDSAYVALYFAARFALQRGSSDPEWRESGRFAVWKIPANLWSRGLNYVMIPYCDAKALADCQHCYEKKFAADPNTALPQRSHRITISNVFPRLYRNERLIAQQGSFVRVTPDLPLDHVLAMMHRRSEEHVCERMDTHLTQYTLPASQALDCLVHLTKMNIRPDTLFPDLTGQMDFINIAASHYDYSGMTDMTPNMRGSMFHWDGRRKD